MARKSEKLYFKISIYNKTRMTHLQIARHKKVIKWTNGQSELKSRCSVIIKRMKIFQRKARFFKHKVCVF